MRRLIVSARMVPVAAGDPKIINGDFIPRVSFVAKIRRSIHVVRATSLHEDNIAGTDSAVLPDREDELDGRVGRISPRHHYRAILHDFDLPIRVHLTAVAWTALKSRSRDMTERGRRRRGWIRHEGRDGEDDQGSIAHSMCVGLRYYLSGESWADRISDRNSGK